MVVGIGVSQDPESRLQAGDLLALRPAPTLRVFCPPIVRFLLLPAVHFGVCGTVVEPPHAVGTAVGIGNTLGGMFCRLQLRD